MKRTLVRSTAFVRAAKRLLKKQPQIQNALRETLILLEEDAFDPKLRTHKLQGNLKDSWGCSLDYELRIIFAIVEEDGNEKILLQTVGSHDDVYS